MTVKTPFEQAYGETLTHQRTAADPAISAWVGASAGSGKTKVLSDRVLRLLLAEGAPTRILCLTFTKAAAAEMERRIAGRLAGWTTLAPGGLEKELAQLLGRAPTPEETGIARSLFAIMLDAPGGLKIQTIHSFCQSVLARFPLEARVAPNFETLDERSALELLGEAREDVLRLIQLKVPEDRYLPLRALLPQVVTFINEMEFGSLINQLIGRREALKESVMRLGGLENAERSLYERLGLPPGLLPETVLAQAAEPGSFDREGLKAAAACLEEGGKSDQAKAGKIVAWLEKPQQTSRDTPQAFFAYCSAFFTDSGKGEPFKKTATQKVETADPDAVRVLERERDRLEKLRDRYFRALEARLSAGLLRMAYHTLEIYERLKRTAAALDYEDQIAATRRLLAGLGVPSWVLYKLDGGIDHLLLDEAQDTSPGQWEVIGALVNEFFEGEGAAQERRADGLPPRSLFTVGDPKQSIYGFQGARPDLFAKKRAAYQRKAREADVKFESVPLNMSFRSTEAVLQVVDAVFEEEEQHKGVVFGEGWRKHTAYRNGHAGSVELWPPLTESDDSEAADPWTPAEEQLETEKARRRLAELLAERIHRWTLGPEELAGEEAKLVSKDRRLAPGDIMILVRRRNAFVTELVRELKKRKVPVAGVDRMKLMDQLAIMDLVAFGQVLLLPEDDLTLASVLKSPLVGLDEEALFELAHDRGPRSLWQQLRERHKERPDFTRAWTLLKSEQSREGYESAYQLYARLLGAEGARKRMLERLGEEAVEPLDEFLSLAQDYARNHPPGLQGFLHWLARDQREVKRDLEQTAGTVRIMTVHAAKGLQAPLVILPDTLGAKRTGREMVWCGDDGDGGGDGDGEGHGTGARALPFFPLKSGQRSELVAEAVAARDELEAEEKRRLLYVAMTRAEDRLIVCGWAGKRDDRNEAWHGHVQRAFDRLEEGGAVIEEQEIQAPELGIEISARRLTCPQTEAVVAEAAQGPRKPETAALPEWARSGKAPKEPTPARPLQPSQPSAPEPASLSPLGETQAWRFKRGNLVHRLLQTLPELPRETWRTAALRFLSLKSHGLTQEQAGAMAEETLAVLESPELAALFGPGSRAEVPVSGVIGTRSISGQVDRLLVTDAEVQIIDYKTNRPAPEDETAVPLAYKEQMASYRALLQRIYPGRKVSCFLLWTEQPRLMKLGEATLDSHSP